MTTALLLLPLLAGCLPEGTAAMRPEAPDRPADVLEVAVDARVHDVASPAAWNARARLGHEPRGAGPAGLRPGQCQAPGEATPAGDRSPEVIALSGPLDGALGWDEAHGRYTTTGPREALDPAWAVGTLRWVDADGIPREATDAVRFGAVPALRSVDRDPDGSVRLGWDPLSVDAVEVHTNGPAGPLVCGAEAGGTVLPWWAVPAVGGDVIVRSVRERTATVDGTLLVVVRAAIERVVPLDRTESAVDRGAPGHLPRPSRLLTTPKGPRRSNRPPSLPTG